MNNEKIVKTEIIDDFTIKEIFENGCYRIVWYWDKKHTKKYSIQYYNSKDKQHRDNDLPSFISYWSNDNIRRKEWEQNEHLHRLTEPARINYDTNGKVKSEQYWIDNELLTKEKFEQHPEVILYKNLKLFNKI